MARNKHDYDPEDRRFNGEVEYNTYITLTFDGIIAWMRDPEKWNKKHYVLALEHCPFFTTTKYMYQMLAALDIDPKMHEGLVVKGRMDYSLFVDIVLEDKYNLVL